MGFPFHHLLRVRRFAGYAFLAIACLGIAYLLACVLGRLPVVPSFTSTSRGDKLDWEMRRRAGREAINCGQVAKAGDSVRVSACVASALREHRALMVRYQSDICFDRVCAEGFVAAPDGHQYILRFVGDDSVNFVQQYVRVTRCAEPFDPARVPPGANAACFAPGAE